MGKIINRVKNSGLETLDLNSFLTSGDRVFFDLKPYLYKGLYLKEKEFRLQLNQMNVDTYKDKHIYVNCSVDAILPLWCYMLVAKKIHPLASTIAYGNLETLEQLLFLKKLESFNFNKYENKKVIIKGCAKIPNPAFAFTTLTTILLPIVQSLMYGEPCSTVPIFKKKK